MFKNTKAFSSFAIKDINKSKEFYGEMLGMEVKETPEGLELHTNGAGEVFMYPKGDQHVPATFTVLNFKVEDINETIDKLVEKGVKFEHYDGEMKTDERGILRGAEVNRGPNIAWFKDPSGNFLSVIENK